MAVKEKVLATFNISKMPPTYQLAITEILFFHFWRENTFYFTLNI